jgi:iron-sulfur cluster assembly accessory protein
MSCCSTGNPTKSVAPSDLEEGPLLSLTEKAVAKVREFAASMEGAEGKPLRIYIQGGGCSGFQYGFTFDDRIENDLELDAGGLAVIVDPRSAPMLKGATVDFVEDFRGSGFTVINPNASGGCGCSCGDGEGSEK